MDIISHQTVIPDHDPGPIVQRILWVPACAGMTGVKARSQPPKDLLQVLTASLPFSPLMFCFLAVALLLLAAPAVAQPTPSEFAYQTDLALDGDGPIYRVPVPPFVYRAVTRHDLGDLRVVNGSGDAVPHAIEHTPRGAAATRTVALPFFALSDTTRATDDPALSIRRDASGTVIELAPRSDRPGRPRTAYLLDARALDYPIRRLTFSWADDAPDFVTSVSIATSTDLAQWTPWVRNATLADLQQGDQRLIRRTVTPDALTKPRFLRLTWPEDETLPSLMRIEAEVTEAEQPMARTWLPAERLDTSGSTYTFRLDARVPADGARISLPEVNTLAEADLHASMQDDGPWRFRASGPVYRLRIDGTELTTPDFSFDPTAAQAWRLRVEPEGALGPEPPALEIGYVPETVLFVARGEGPFRLVFGHHAAESVALPPATVLGGVPRVEGRSLIAPARTGERVEVAGPSALLAPTEVPVRRILLWGVLVLGVALLGWMALRLLRQLRTEHPPA